MLARLSSSVAKTPSLAFSSVAAGRLHGKIALITGASAGIGRETALLFAKHGCEGLVIADMNEKDGISVMEAINALESPTKAVFIKTDVSKANDCKKAVELAENTFGRLQIMFNNAGVMLMDDDDAVSTEEAVWDQTFAVNVKGVFFGCKYAIPALRRAGGGSIINTASFVAKMGAATPQLAYTSTKGAVSAMTRELAVLHARENMRFNALCPGPLRTKLLMDFLDTEEKKQRRLVHLPMGRFGEAQEMAQAVLFLASDESSYVNGTDFMVDGGLCSAYVTPQ